MSNTCSSFDVCKSPLCPMDASFNQAIWYPDEEICPSHQFRKEHWRKIQAKIKRLNENVKPVTGFFNLAMLKRISRVRAGICGLNPDKARV